MSHTHYRNRKILQFAKCQPCQHCGTNDGTTVAAHSNLMRDGKGVGIKSDDCYVAYLCHKCHEQYDRKLKWKYLDHNGIYVEGRLFSQDKFDNAMKQTIKLWLMAEIVK